MTYFADLSPYSYGSTAGEAALSGEPPDLNVGWLEAGHDFTKGTPPEGFVEALLRCCTRAIRHYKGYHFCDLCPYDYRTPVHRLDLKGRLVELGNGEVRVRGPEGRWYTAPTLVAHYVVQHQYLPPEPFLAGVLERAKTITIICEEDLDALRRITVPARYQLCLKALAAFESRVSDPALHRVVDALAAVAPAIEPGHLDEWNQKILVAKHELLAAQSAIPDEAFEVASTVFNGFLRAVFNAATRGDEQTLNETTLFCTAGALQSAIECGVLKGWNAA